MRRAGSALRTVLPLLGFLGVPTGGWTQVAGSGPSCLNCPGAWFNALLLPTEGAETFTCALDLTFELDVDGAVEGAEASEDAPSLCRRSALDWIALTRWALAADPSAPALIRLPLEFELDRQVKPGCLEGCAVDGIMERLRRTSRGRPGPNCVVVAKLRILEDGGVDRVEMANRGDDPRCVRLVREWASETRWSPAYKDGEPVTVWIEQEVRFRTTPAAGPPARNRP